jgi:xylose isomerase
MKSFGIKRDEKDPRWVKFIEWLNDSLEININGDILKYYGFCRDGSYGDANWRFFDSIITLDEWEAEFMQPKLAGREYDLELIRAYKRWQDGTIQQFIEHRYAKTDRIAELKQQIEKLSNELKELEG